MLTKTTEGKLKDVDVTQVTPENYIVPAAERHLYHVKQELVRFSSQNGARLSHPRIQKYGKKAYESVIGPELKKQGFELTVLYNPTAYVKSQAAAREEAEALRNLSAAERAQAEQARIDAAVAAALEKYKADEAAKAAAESHEMPAAGKTTTKAGKRG